MNMKSQVKRTRADGTALRVERAGNRKNRANTSEFEHRRKTSHGICRKKAHTRTQKEPKSIVQFRPWSPFAFLSYGALSFLRPRLCLFAAKFRGLIFVMCGLFAAVTSGNSSVT